MNADNQPSIALQIQLLDTDKNRALVLAGIVASRSSDQRFTVSEVTLLARLLRLPPFSNLSSNLARLRSDRMAISEGGGRWALTPLGEQSAMDQLAGLDVAQIEAMIAPNSGALFADVEHLIVPPEFAPPRWTAGINRLLKRFPFETNVFCMTRFPEEDADEIDPVLPVIEAIRSELKIHGLTLHLASDRQIEDDLLGNIGAYMWACKYGIGLLEARTGELLNYNTVIELGSMIVTGRRCAVLRDVSTPNPPTDLSGQIYKSVNFEDIGEVRRAVSGWVIDDLMIG